MGNSLLETNDSEYKTFVNRMNLEGFVPNEDYENINLKDLKDAECTFTYNRTHIVLLITLDLMEKEIQLALVGQEYFIPISFKYNSSFLSVIQLLSSIKDEIDHENCRLIAQQFLIEDIEVFYNLDVYSIPVIKFKPDKYIQIINDLHENDWVRVKGLIEGFKLIENDICLVRYNETFKIRIVIFPDQNLLVHELTRIESKQLFSKLLFYSNDLEAFIKLIMSTQDRLNMTTYNPFVKKMINECRYVFFDNNERIIKLDPNNLI